MRERGAAAKNTSCSHGAYLQAPDPAVRSFSLNDDPGLPNSESSSRRVPLHAAWRAGELGRRAAPAARSRKRFSHLKRRTLADHATRLLWSMPSFFQDPRTIPPRAPGTTLLDLGTPLAYHSP